MNKLMILVLVMLSFISCTTWKSVEPEAIALAKTIYTDVAPAADDLSILSGHVGLYDGTVHMLPLYFSLVDSPILVFVHEQTHHYQTYVLRREGPSPAQYTADISKLICNLQLEIEQEACLVESFIALTKYGFEEYRGYDKSNIPYMVKYMEKWMHFTFSK